jgi:hypothetical protein
MKLRVKYTLISGLLIVVGFCIWKFFSKPLPLPESLAEIPSSANSPSDNGVTFPELVVGGTNISPDDLRWEFELHTSLPKFEDSDETFGVPVPQDKSKPSPVIPPEGPELRERVISSVIERKILYTYIKDKTPGFNLNDPGRYTKCLAQVNDVSAASPEFFSKPKSRERIKTKLCEQSIIEQYLAEQLFGGLTATPEEVQSYYRRHEKDFKKPARVILRQIVVADEAKAHALRKEVKPSNFIALARQNSMAPEATNGGLVGPFSKEQLPTLFDIAFSLGIGEISGVIKSEYGFHIMMPIERFPPQTQPLAEVSDAIRNDLTRTKKMEIYQKWLNAAMNAVSVTSPSSGVAP